MRIHHGYIGAALMLWSMAVIGFNILMIGKFTPWLAWGGLLFGMGLLVHDVWCHANHRKRR